MVNKLTDVTGFRGEKILELCLTDYQNFPQPLFRPGFLGGLQDTHRPRVAGAWLKPER